MANSDSHLSVSDEEIVETLLRILNAGEKHEAATLLRKSRTRFEETGCDNWNGGTYSITLYVQVAPETFTLLGERRTQVEEEITETLRLAVNQLSTDTYDAKIAPLIVGMRGRPDIQGNPIPKRIRRPIINRMRRDKFVWHGSLSAPEFLEPLYDLEKLPSNDSHFRDAKGDIWQHTVNNDDWELSWIFDDDRFNLLNGSDSEFLAFLERCLDPAVRAIAESMVLAEEFNKDLRSEGWSLETMELM